MGKKEKGKEGFNYDVAETETIGIGLACRIQFVGNIILICCWERKLLLSVADGVCMGQNGNGIFV